MKITVLSLILFVTPALAIQPDEILKTLFSKNVRVLSARNYAASFVKISLSMTLMHP